MDRYMRERNERIVRLWNKHHSAWDIARACHCSTSAVYAVVERARRGGSDVIKRYVYDRAW